MNSSFATRLFRIVFYLAGCYNLAFGIWARCWPLSFFSLFEIAPPRYPMVWSCVGMVVGLYGLLYWHAAWKLETARPIIAVGLLGKVLGPIGMLLNFSDQWPLRLAMLNVYNDLIWWLPFALFLLRGTAISKRLVAAAPWCCAGLHCLGLWMMAVVLERGMLTVPAVAQRAAYVAHHCTLWAIGWSVWMLAATSLVAFYAWWAAQLSSAKWAMVCVLIAVLGSVCDFSGESLSSFVLVERAGSVSSEPNEARLAEYRALERTSTLLTAAAANSLYTIAGLGLMFGTKRLPWLIQAAMWGTWISGGVMTASALANYVPGMTVSTVVLFPLLIGWTAWMGRRWRPV